MPDDKVIHALVAIQAVTQDQLYLLCPKYKDSKGGDIQLVITETQNNGFERLDHCALRGLVEELQILKEENEKLARENDRVAKAREEQIVKARQQATDQKGSQLNMVEARKPSLLSKIKDFLRRRRIKLATVPRANYEQAIINQAMVAVPKMLDTIETMHESLTVLEELLAKHKEREKVKKSEKHPHR
jgi:acyl-CoA reductase-like NAD-dependent aldehyde dehydrogenase